MSDAEPTAVGVLGAADIALRRTIPAIQRCDGLRLAAVASRDEAKAGAVAERFGCRAVTGYERLLERDDVQAVYIPLPNSLHEEWAEAALRAGKHVLVEKSLTASAAAAQRLVDLARSAGLAFMENFAFLHHPQHDAVRKMIAEGAIGEPRILSAAFGIPSADRSLIRYRADLAGGALRETGCYTVRVAQLYLGEDLTVVGAAASGADGIDLTGTALLADGAGVTAQLAYGMDHAYRNTYAVWGSEGRVEVDWAFTPPPQTRPVVRLHRQNLREERVLPPADQFVNMVTAFAQACADPAGHQHHGDDAVRQARLLESIAERVR